MDKLTDTSNFAGLDEDTYNKLVGQLTTDQPLSEDAASDWCNEVFDVGDDDDDSIEDA
jgi:hypothetical protein